jgi:MerR family redox-sensitive transcriptional activator SoxR
MRIGEVARRAGVRVSRIRYYEEVGVLPEAERVSGQRRYDDRVLRRLAVIDVAQRAGLSLDEIRALLEHGDDPMSARLRELAGRRLPEVDALIDRRPVRAPLAPGRPGLRLPGRRRVRALRRGRGAAGRPRAARPAGPGRGAGAIRAGVRARLRAERSAPP